MGLKQVDIFEDADAATKRALKMHDLAYNLSIATSRELLSQIDRQFGNIDFTPGSRDAYFDALTKGAAAIETQAHRLLGSIIEFNKKTRGA